MGVHNVINPAVKIIPYYNFVLYQLFREFREFLVRKFSAKTLKKNYEFANFPLRIDVKDPFSNFTGRKCFR